jgi:hypothetical protein
MTSVGHTLLRKCFLKHIFEGKIQGKIKGTKRRGIRRKQLLDDFKDKSSYWNLKGEALDRILWRTRFGRGYGQM